MLSLDTSYTLSQIPYITYDALDEYAEKLIRDFAPELLDIPAPVDVNRFLADYLGLRVDTRRIACDRKTLAITAFHDGSINVINEDACMVEPMRVTAGMVIVDASLQSKRSEPRLRITLTHEGCHWLLHRKVLSLGNPFGSGHLAAKEGRADYSRSQRESTDAQRMERQADFLASAILMPRPALRKVFRAFFKANGDTPRVIYRGATELDDCYARLLPRYTAQVFWVSKHAALIRLEKVGAIADKPTEKYALLVKSLAPELWTGVAFRRTGRFTEPRKSIKCPYCGRTLVNVGINTKIEMHRYPRKTDLSCHEYRTCNICHETVGIIFASA